MKKHSLPKQAIAAVTVAGALAGLGAGVAEARPMERDNKRYCAKIISDYEFTAKAYMDALNKYGRDDRLTLQAASNAERAANAFVSSPC